MLGDISHIAGARPLLHEVAQAAMDLDYSGLMVEVHPDPQNALSDAHQQITLDGLDALMASLERRDVTEWNGMMPPELHQLRKEIDALDAAILEKLGLRMELSRQIGEIKQEYDLPILQSERWESVLEQSKARAMSLGLSEQVVEAIFRSIHRESIEQQMDAMKVSPDTVND
jgi:chorismate mutase